MPVLEMVPLGFVATPIYMQVRMGNVVHLCAQRRGHEFTDQSQSLPQKKKKKILCLP